MQLHDFLRGLHEVLKPRTYLEIGVRDGRSLALSRSPTVGVDPKFKVIHEIQCDVQLIKDTSDAFFARGNPLAHFNRTDPAVDLALIDGMHLSEFALRDFMNVEKHSSWLTVIVLDDVLPRNVDEAARDRHTGEWAGDVYKVAAILREHRPDLITLHIDTQPTGILIVFGADPASTTLRSRYAELESALISPDPQDVPADVLKRSGALSPTAVLGASFWSELVSARSHDDGRQLWPEVSRRIREELQPRR